MGTDPISLHLMTFNLKNGGSPPPNSWDERRPITAALIRVAAAVK